MIILLVPLGNMGFHSIKMKSKSPCQKKKKGNKTKKKKISHLKKCPINTSSGSG